MHKGSKVGRIARTETQASSRNNADWRNRALRTVCASATCIIMEFEKTLSDTPKKKVRLRKHDRIARTGTQASSKHITSLRNRTVRIMRALNLALLRLSRILL